MFFEVIAKPSAVARLSSAARKLLLFVTLLPGIDEVLSPVNIKYAMRASVCATAVYATMKMIGCKIRVARPISH